MPTETGTNVGGKISFPIIDAVRMSLGNMRMRFTKTLITIASVTLGAAFVVFLTMTTIIFRVYAQHSGVSVPIEAYQYWLLSISLFVCVVSITNSMLIAVLERCREIGVMKCLGALDRHILLLFLLESTIFGLIGGVLGFIFGGVASVVTHGIQLGFDAVLRVSAYDVLSCLELSISLAVILSIIATLYPAYRAAKFSPVEALSFQI
jgi:ABC-type antimicrobial peptide transport system permease subunit